MKLLRKLHRRLSLLGSHRRFELGGQTVKFCTPNPAVEEVVASWAKEEVLLQHFLEELRPGDVVWDIGANIGFYTVFSAARLGREGKVLAFEPEKGVRSLLEQNIKLNQLSNAVPYPYALGDEDGEAWLYPSATANIGLHSLIFRTDNKLKAKGQLVPVWRGDSLVQKQKTPAPTVVKIDVEGFELKVLQGMKQCLQSPVLRLIHCEVHPKLLTMAGIKAEEVEALIKQYGFSVTYGDKRGSEFYLMGKR